MLLIQNMGLCPNIPDQFSCACPKKMGEKKGYSEALAKVDRIDLARASGKDWIGV